MDECDREEIIAELEKAIQRLRAGANINLFSESKRKIVIPGRRIVRRRIKLSYEKDTLENDPEPARGRCWEDDELPY